ncbi:DEAD/DEAH box helicase [Actinopolymorpha pittospori]|uniref:Probable helicase HelY n=1 Tax=Actinopolymorpha pittospori TaxID=648752 RepID=A0A927RBW6_9ACTN|nr:DEAD/DEAH box helicase [Actinopolymorpha pittospori]MBE1610592.1 ATP-dependent RNA helicase HelY [Actinopolymorpha pittospori]
MSSPAERYARFQDGNGTSLQAFRQLYDFDFDPFQVTACRALEEGRGVLVAAPTGSGKTVVGEFAVHRALETGGKCFYTTPIKALSNQKFAELAQRYGSDQVGLLTGDNTINGEAPVVVMTTEVLRNMLYAGSSTLRGLSYVVMDEVHYLADPFRGATWEEVIIHLPESVQLVSLSATVSNAEEFGEWLATVRGHTEIVVEERRPVPLFQHVMVGRRMYDLFADTGRPDAPAKVNPELARIVRDHWRFAKRDDRGPRRTRQPRGGNRIAFTPSRAQVAEKLEGEGLLPAIVFIFSRQACDAAVLQCMYAGIRLTRPDQAAEIRAYVESRTADLPADDLAVLGYYEWLEGLERGIAAHHAGMLPTFKEVVEVLFARGLVKLVFATETLALGINMPARSVVLEKLVKWNGQTHADVTPGEYTQLTGRAGRRGIDVEGHGVVLWQPGLDPGSVAGLASTRTYPLRSSFRPSYNMAVNLVRQVGRERARELLESSFAQFQADRAVVGLVRQVRRSEEALEGYREAMQCHLGDFLEYATIRRKIKERENQLSRRNRADRRAEVVDSLGRLRSGDVIQVPAGRQAGIAVVLDPGHAAGGDGPRPTVLTEDHRVRRLSLVDFPLPVEALTRMRLPRSFNPRNAQQRRDLASTLRQKAPEELPPMRRRRGGSPAEEDQTLQDLRAAMRAHPCHGCDEREDHARWSERYLRLERETEGLQRRVDARSNTIARQFDRVCEVLDELGYLKGDRTTEAGDRLSRIYTELDLVAAEALRQGTWDKLTPPELAASLSALAYESRTPDDVGPPKLPGGAAKEALGSLVRIWGDLEALERDFHVDFLREPDLGFAWAAYRWASGMSLANVLDETGFAAGDFVRWIKQILDLADQVADAAGAGPLRTTARATVEALRRGVVAYASVGSDAT